MLRDRRDGEWDILSREGRRGCNQNLSQGIVKKLTG
jgi:hypothetical protein